MTSAYLDVVFDGPPSEWSRLLDCEDGAGHSVKAGSWVDRNDGTWALRLTHRDVPAEPDPYVTALERELRASRALIRHVVKNTGAWAETAHSARLYQRWVERSADCSLAHAELPA